MPAAATAKDIRERHVLLVEYDGTPYCGSQYQRQGETIRPTVQAALQGALSALGLRKILGDAISLQLASRTDTGVHALGQVAHFDLPAGALAHVGDLATALNATLPDAISIRQQALGVDPAFHSRASALRRWYRYTIFNGDQRSAWMPRNAVWVRRPLDDAAMDTAARVLWGRHNFKSFKHPDTGVVDDVCLVEHAQVTRDGDWVYFDVVATRFLYKMVRNLAGLLLVVGRHKAPDGIPVSPEIVREILEKQDHASASRFAPTEKPQGLTLMAIGYPAEKDFFADDGWVRQMNQRIKPLMNPTMNATLSLEQQHDEDVFRKAS